MQIGNVYNIPCHAIVAGMDVTVALRDVKRRSTHSNHLSSSLNGFAMFRSYSIHQCNDRVYI